jgi:hypothetical protein
MSSEVRPMSRKHPKRTARPGVDRAGRTPLHYAAVDGAIADAARLIGAGADPNAQDDEGWTPLHFAAQSGSPDIVRALIAAGAKVDTRDNHGNTPLFRAVFSSSGDGTIIELLRAAGADPQAANTSRKHQRGHAAGTRAHHRQFRRGALLRRPAVASACRRPPAPLAQRLRSAPVLTYLAVEMKLGFAMPMMTSTIFFETVRRCLYPTQWPLPLL